MHLPGHLHASISSSHVPSLSQKSKSTVGGHLSIQVKVQ